MGAVLDAEEVVFDAVAKIVNQHNMMDRGRPTNPRHIRWLIDDYQNLNDNLHDLRVEAQTAIETALTNFAEQVGQYVVHVIGPSKR